MKFVAGLVASAVLAMSPLAHAQIACDDVDLLAELAWDDFADISGEVVAGDDLIYQTDFWLEDADECYVGIDLVALYACQWVFASEQDASGIFDAFIEAFDVCLAGWTREQEGAGEPNGEMTPLRTLYFIGTGANSDLEWTLALDRHEAAGVLDFHIGIALSYW